jgi:hypothetical protein
VQRLDLHGLAITNTFKLKAVNVKEARSASVRVTLFGEFSPIGQMLNAFRQLF